MNLSDLYGCRLFRENPTTRTTGKPPIWAIVLYPAREKVLPHKGKNATAQGKLVFNRTNGLRVFSFSLLYIYRREPHRGTARRRPFSLLLAASASQAGSQCHDTPGTPKHPALQG
jgi:hypothetical protein